MFYFFNIFIIMINDNLINYFKNNNYYLGGHYFINKIVWYNTFNKLLKNQSPIGKIHPL